MNDGPYNLDAFYDFFKKYKLGAFYDFFKKYKLLIADPLGIQHVLDSVRRTLEPVTAPLAQLAARFSMDRWLRGAILETAEDGLQSGELSEDDAKHLTQARDEFQSRFDSMMSASAYPADALAAVQSAFAIALYSKDPENIRRAFAKHTKPARDGKKIVDGTREQALYKAIVSAAENMKVVLTGSIERARALHPEVRRLLGLESDNAAEVRKQLGLRSDDTTWPSPGTIKTASAKIIKSAKANRAGR